MCLYLSSLFYMYMYVVYVCVLSISSNTFVSRYVCLLVFFFLWCVSWCMCTHARVVAACVSCLINFAFISIRVLTCILLCVYVCTCVCVWHTDRGGERERERERDSCLLISRASLGVLTCIFFDVSMSVGVCVKERERERERCIHPTWISGHNLVYMGWFVSLFVCIRICIHACIWACMNVVPIWKVITAFFLCRGTRACIILFTLYHIMSQCWPLILRSAYIHAIMIRLSVTASLVSLCMHNTMVN
jgi:hypothetical protein